MSGKQTESYPFRYNKTTEKNIKEIQSKLKLSSFNKTLHALIDIFMKDVPKLKSDLKETKSKLDERDKECIKLRRELDQLKSLLRTKREIEQQLDQIISK